MNYSEFEIYQQLVNAFYSSIPKNNIDFKNKLFKSFFNKLINIFGINNKLIINYFNNNKFNKINKNNIRNYDQLILITCRKIAKEMIKNKLNENNNELIDIINTLNLYFRPEIEKAIFKKVFLLRKKMGYDANAILFFKRLDPSIKKIAYNSIQFIFKNVIDKYTEIKSISFYIDILRKNMEKVLTNNMNLISKEGKITIRSKNDIEKYSEKITEEIIKTIINLI